MSPNSWLDDPRAGAALAVVAVLPVVVWQWGFTVDDALISARYAHHLASGEGYRFNPGGPITDGVTPLGWAHLLAPMAKSSVWAGYRAAKWLSAASWLCGVAGLGAAVAKLGGSGRRWLGLALLALSAPIGAWAAAGMETGLVMGLSAGAMAARASGSDRLGAGLMGWVGAWRPETLPFVFTVAVAPRRGATSGRERAIAVLFSLGPAAGVALLRSWLFGRAVPLAAWAKTPVPLLGLRYALAAFIVLGGLAAVWPRAPSWVRGLQVAVFVHFSAVALAGGDWMPLARLGVVAMPAVALIACERLARPGWWRCLPWGLALLAPVYTSVNVGPRAAGVEATRLQTMDSAREPLSEAEVVATLDIGWVGAVHPGTVVDLAGVTDPTVAVLPGGHTSKAIPRSIVGGRDIDTFVLLAAGETREPWVDTRWSRWVEAHVAHLPEVATSFAMVARLEPLTYVVVRRSKGRTLRGGPSDRASASD